MEDHKRYILLSSVITALGVTLSTALKSDSKVFGIILIAMGGLLFFIGMRKKQQDDNR